MLHSDLPLYFCGLPFTGAQVGRKLSWLLAAGEIREVLQGVYGDSRIPDSLDLRAAAASLLTPDGAVVCGMTAAWIHGISTTALGPSKKVQLQWTREARDVVEVAGLRVTSPIATAVELAMQLPRPFALSAIDALLRSGAVDLWAIRAASAEYAGQPGIHQARQILRYADRRAGSPGESWLRLRLLDAGFGRPELQVRVKGQEREYRLDIGYPEPVDDGRRLGMEYDSDQWHSRQKDELRDETRRTELEELGWHVIPVRRTDVWGSYPALELAVGEFLSVCPRLPRRW